MELSTIKSLTPQHWISFSAGSPSQSAVGQRYRRGLHKPSGAPKVEQQIWYFHALCHPHSWHKKLPGRHSKLPFSIPRTRSLHPEIFQNPSLKILIFPGPRTGSWFPKTNTHTLALMHLNKHLTPSTLKGQVSAISILFRNIAIPNQSFSSWSCSHKYSSLAYVSPWGLNLVLSVLQRPPPPWDA